MADTIRIGAIGCGGIAGKHIDTFLARPDTDIVGLMDPDPNSLSRTVARFAGLSGTPEFEDHNEMIDECDLDAVVICSPHNVHFRQIMNSLEAGLHVLTEKPMVCTIEDACEVMEKEEEVDRIVAVAYQRHCQGQFQYIRNAIESGQAGQVRYLSALQGQAWLYLTEGTWRQKMELSCGGQLNDSGSHLIDIILWMTGLAVDEVSASIDNCGTEVDIDSALQMTFKNGALGTLSVIGSYPAGGMYEDITIICDEWSFFLRQGQLEVKTGLEGENHRVDGFQYGSPSPADNFIDAIHGEAEVLAPSVCGLRTIELTEAAWKSAERGGEPVKV